MFSEILCCPNITHDHIKNVVAINRKEKAYNLEKCSQNKITLYYLTYKNVQNTCHCNKAKLKTNSVGNWGKGSREIDVHADHL